MGGFRSRAVLKAEDSPVSEILELPKGFTPISKSWKSLHLGSGMDYHELVAAWWPPTGFYAEFWKLFNNKAISLSVYVLRMIVDTGAKRPSCGMKDCAPHGSANESPNVQKEKS